MEVKKKDKFTILVLTGDLTSDDVVLTFKSKVQELIDSGETYIVLDFANVRIINSNGIGKILLFYKKLKEKSGSLSFVNLNDNIADLFDKLMFVNLFKIYNSYDDIA